MCFLSIFPLTGLLIIILLIGLKVFALKRNGISFKPEKSKSTTVNKLIYAFFVFALLIWLAALADQIFNWHTFLHSSLLTKKLITSNLITTAGAGIIFVSILLMAITLLHFKTSLRFGLNSTNQGKLITKGIFAYSRNPFFLSLDFYFIGHALIFPGILFIAITLMAITVIHLYILREEKFLSLYYGSSYNIYRQKVRRYL